MEGMLLPPPPVEASVSDQIYLFLNGRPIADKVVTHALKEAFYDNEEYKKRFNFIKKANYLLLDDIGADSVTEWSRDEVLGTILQYRMEEKLPTFFTSNLTLAELEDHLATTNKEVDHIKSRRIIERIKQLTTSVTMISENKRKWGYYE